MKKIVSIIFAIVLVFVLANLTFIYRLLFWNSSGIEDYELFPFTTIQSSKNSFFFDIISSESLECEKVFNKIEYSFEGKKHYDNIDDLIEKTNTTAFIVIKDNKILIEKYANGYSRDSINRSFSVAKSIMSILIGIAIDHGLIKSVDESICVYIKELDKDKYGEVQIKHLLNMESGFAFTDNGLPWCDGAHLYYEPNVRKYTLNNLKIVEKPGKTFLYNNYCTVLLGIILERVSKMTISEYCQKYFWEKIGTEYEAYWSIDSEENAFEQVPSGFNARAIDFAKLGILMLNKGIYNNQQIVSKKWIEESVKLDTSKIDLYKNIEMGENIYYNYQWWGHYITNHENNIFASGHLGQLIYICPSKNLIICRFGKERGNINYGWHVIAKWISEKI